MLSIWKKRTTPFFNMRPYCFDNPTLYLRAQMSSPKNIETRKKKKIRYASIDMRVKQNKSTIGTKVLWSLSQMKFWLLVFLFFLFSKRHLLFPLMILKTNLDLKNISTRVSNETGQCNFSGQRDRSFFLVPGQRDNGTS